MKYLLGMSFSLMMVGVFSIDAMSGHSMYIVIVDVVLAVIFFIASIIICSHFYDSLNINEE